MLAFIPHLGLIRAHEMIAVKRPSIIFPTRLLLRSLFTLYFVLLAAVAFTFGAFVIVSVFFVTYACYYYYLLSRIWRQLGLSRVRLAILTAAVMLGFVAVRICVKWRFSI